MGCGFKPHRSDKLILDCTGSTQEDPSQHNSKIVDWNVKNQIMPGSANFEIWLKYLLVMFWPENYFKFYC